MRGRKSGVRLHPGQGLALAFACLPVAASTQPPVGPWETVQGGTMGAVTFIPTSLRREGATFTLIVRSTPGGMAGIGAIVTQRRYDCARRRVLVLRMTAWDERGTQIYDGPPHERGERSANPGGASAAIMDRFCPPAGQEPAPQ